jgi:hypothetical protein
MHPIFFGEFKHLQSPFSKKILILGFPWLPKIRENSTTELKEVFIHHLQKGHLTQGGSAEQS